MSGAPLRLAWSASATSGGTTRGCSRNLEGVTLVGVVDANGARAAEVAAANDTPGDRRRRAI